MTTKKPINEVGTTTEMNLACAKLAGTFQQACWLFRQLEHANGRGTGESQFDILKKYFNPNQKQKTPGSRVKP